MAYYTYIIKSEINGRYYIGSTDCLDRRLALHNEGNSISTKAYMLWALVYYETYKTKSEALKREIHLKRMKNKKYIDCLIYNNSGGRPY